MSTRTKGKCKYCGKEYTKAYIVRHLAFCEERKIKIAVETEKNNVDILNWLFLQSMIEIIGWLLKYGKMPRWQTWMNF